MRQSGGQRDCWGASTVRCVSSVVFSKDGKKVLLHLRGDVLLWSLPGGGVEPGETWEDAAVREVYEETGYHIAIDGLVGEYQRPQMPDLKRLFIGHVTGGEAIKRVPETIKVGWFPVGSLPWNRLPWTREYIEDAISCSPELIKKTQLQTYNQRLAMLVLFKLDELRHRLTGRG